MVRSTVIDAQRRHFVIPRMSRPPRPAYRPETKFERRGLRLGHGVWDLVFRRLPTA